MLVGQVEKKWIQAFVVWNAIDSIQQDCKASALRFHFVTTLLLYVTQKPVCHSFKLTVRFYPYTKSRVKLANFVIYLLHACCSIVRDYAQWLKKVCGREANQPVWNWDGRQKKTSRRMAVIPTSYFWRCFQRFVGNSMLLSCFTCFATLHRTERFRH